MFREGDDDLGAGRVATELGFDPYERPTSGPGPCEDEDAVAAWREHPGFQERVAEIQELVEDFGPHSMTLAAEVGPATPDPG